MLRKLSLALAVSCASNGMAWAEAPLSNKTDLVSVYQEAVNNNADLAAAMAQYGAQKEVVPQARAGLLPNLSGGAQVSSARTSLDQPSTTANRNAHSLPGHAGAAVVPRRSLVPVPGRQGRQ